MALPQLCACVSFHLCGGEEGGYLVPIFVHVFAYVLKCVRLSAWVWVRVFGCVCLLALARNAPRRALFVYAHVCVGYLWLHPLAVPPTHAAAVTREHRHAKVRRAPPRSHTLSRLHPPVAIPFGSAAHTCSGSPPRACAAAAAASARPPGTRDRLAVASAAAAAAAASSFPEQVILGC